MNKKLLWEEQGVLNEYHPTLGWVLRANQKLNPTFCTGAHGVRMNQNEIKPLQKGGILVSGDSFDAGSAASCDAMTYSAILERRLGIPVNNAATGFWSLGQTLLRIEELAPILEPKIVICGCLRSQIERQAYDIHSGGYRPIFKSVGTTDITHENNPIPTTRKLHHLLTDNDKILSDDETFDVCSRLIEWYGQSLQVAWNFKGIILFQYGYEDIVGGTRPHFMPSMIKKAQESNIIVVDTFDPLFNYLYKNGKEKFDELYFVEPNGQRGHPNDAHYEFLADLLCGVIKPIL